MRQPAKTILVLAMAVALSMASINANASPIDKQEEIFGSREEEVASNSQDSSSLPTNFPPDDEPSFSSGALHRLLTGYGKQLTCDRDPRVCLSRSSAGPFCCTKTCVDVRTDRLNCGLCGRKCKYNETCCKGNCVNLGWDNKNCGRCDKRCAARHACAYGMCNYA